MTTLRAAVAVLIAGAVAGCGVTPDAVPVDNTAAEYVRVPAAPGEWNTGEFSTEPLDVDELITDDPDRSGRITESERLAEFVLLPQIDVDPALDTLLAQYTGTQPGGASLHFVLTGGAPENTIVEIAERHGLYAGYSTARKTPPSAGDANSREMIHGVFEFPDAGAAAAAAAELHEDRLTSGWSAFASASPAVPHSIDALPDSYLGTEVGDTSVTTRALTPHGRFVIYTELFAAKDRREWIDPTMVKIVELQRALIDTFPYTPVEDIASLGIDMHGVLRLTMAGGQMRHQLSVFGPRGVAHTWDDQDGIFEILNDTGTRHMAVNGTNLFAADTSEGATELFDFLVDAALNNTVEIATPAAGPPGVPDILCFDVIAPENTYSRCILLQGRYVAQAGSVEGLTVVHPAMTAQYLKLLDA